MAFSLAALGSGLGQFAQDYRQQQEAALRQQQMKLQMAQFQQKQLEQQQMRQAQASLWPQLLSGEIGGAQPIQGQSVAPTQSGGDLGGGLRAGGALTGGSDPRNLIPYIQETARKYNIDPAIAVQVARSEGLGNPIGDGGKSGGAFQLYTGGGVGNEFQRDTGLDPLQPQNERQTIDYALKTAAQRGWGPWHGAAKVGIQPWQGISRGGTPQATPASYSPPPAEPGGGEYGSGQSAPGPVTTNSIGERYNYDPNKRWSDPNKPWPGGSPGAATATLPSAGQQDFGGGADIMAPVRREVQQGIQSVAKITPPSVYGKMGIQGLARQIDKAAPDASPAVKFMMLQEAQTLLAPDAKMQWEAYKEQHNENFQKEMAVFRDNLSEGSEKRREALAEQKQDARNKQGGDLLTDPETGKQFIYNKFTKQATTLDGEPYTPSGAQKLGGAGGSGSPLSADRAKDLAGETSRLDKEYVAANPLATDSEKQQAHFKNRATAEKVLAEAKTGSGGMQAAQQMNRVTAAANLLSAELTNMSELPAMSTASIFQGIEALPGKHPGEAIKRTMAAAITPEDSTDLITSFQGVARAVAALETSGAATGLVGLTESARAYQPAATDTVGNVMRKFATLRQILERGLESSAAAKGVTPEQRELYEKIKKEVAQAVPFTVEDVTKLRKGDGETYRQLFDRTRKPKEPAGEAEAASGAAREFTAPLPGAIESGYRFRGGDATKPENWERVQ